MARPDVRVLFERAADSRLADGARALGKVVKFGAALGYIGGVFFAPTLLGTGIGAGASHFVDGNFSGAGTGFFAGAIINIFWGMYKAMDWSQKAGQ